MKSLLIYACGAALSLGAGGAALAANAKVCFEADKPVSIVTPLRVVKTADKEVSGGGYLEIPWDQNKTKGIGSATYKVYAKTAGTYYLWARTFWANGCGNSVKVSVNNQSDKVLGQDGQYDSWHWVGGRERVALKAGLNAFVLKNRETGVRVNQFFLCQDPDYTPTGIRKDTQ